MSKDRTLSETLHEATHRLPGVPEHRELPAGHQGTARHGRSLQSRPLQDRGTGSHQGSAPAHDRPPRVLASWQNWIGGLFSRKHD